MSQSLKVSTVVALIVACSSIAIANHTPQHERHELMESVRDAAKPVGLMLRGEKDFDSDELMASLKTWESAGEVFGDLFPEGSDTGENTEAAPAIWTDREGFNAALAEWQTATGNAIAAAPQTLEDARKTVGPAFQTCKGCHDTYRIEDEE